MAGGRPKKVWEEKDYKQFEAMCSIQATIEEIENVLDIDHKTVDRLCKEHYTDENGQPLGFSQAYKKYSAGGKMSLRRIQFELAKKNAAMAIFLGKQYLNQRDTPVDSEDDTFDKLDKIWEDIKREAKR